MGTVPLGGRWRLRRVKVLYRFSKVSGLVYLLYKSTTELSTSQNLYRGKTDTCRHFCRHPYGKTRTACSSCLCLPPPYLARDCFARGGVSPRFVSVPARAWRAAYLPTRRIDAPQRGHTGEHIKIPLPLIHVRVPFHDAQEKLEGPCAFPSRPWQTSDARLPPEVAPGAIGHGATRGPM